MTAWDEARDSFRVGQRVAGTVVRHEPYGLYVDIGCITAFVDVLEITDGIMRGTQDYPSIGQTVEGFILQFNNRSKQIRMSLRNLDFGHNPPQHGAN